MYPVNQPVLLGTRFREPVSYFRQRTTALNEANHNSTGCLNDNYRAKSGSNQN